MAKRKPLAEVQKEINETLKRIRQVGRAGGTIFGGREITDENYKALVGMLSELTRLEEKYRQLVTERHRRISN